VMPWLLLLCLRLVNLFTEARIIGVMSSSLIVVGRRARNTPWFEEMLTGEFWGVLDNIRVLHGSFELFIPDFASLRAPRGRVL